MLVVFEGISGAGKSTQIAKVKKKLIELGFKVVIYHGKDIGALVDLKKMGERFPFASLERDLIHGIMRMAKEMEVRNLLFKTPLDTIVLVDRLWGSIIAYSARTLNLSWGAWKKLAKIFIQPDLTLLFDISHANSAARKRNSLILKDKKIFNEVRANYLRLAKDFKWKIIHGEKDDIKNTGLIVNLIKNKTTA